MMEREPCRTYDSLGDFYQEVYGHVLAELHNGGSIGAEFMEARQGAGDWSDAPTPALTLALLASRPVRATFDFGSGRFEAVAQPGDIVLAAPAAGSTVLAAGDHVIRVVALPYQPLLNLTGGDDSPLPGDGDFGRLHADQIRDRALSGLIDAMWLEASTGGVNGALFMDGAILQMAATLLRVRDGAGEPAATGLASWQLRRATEFLMARMEGEVTLAELAAELDLSASYLCRAFKASTGSPPWRWLAEQRMARAKALLADPDLSLTDIAQMVGYAGQSTFGEAFRRATGTSPGKYRRGL